MTRGMDAQEKRWRAESDANTLMNVEEIKSDAPRKKAALAELKKREKEIKKTLKTVKTVTATKKKTKPRSKKKK